MNRDLQLALAPDTTYVQLVRERATAHVPSLVGRIALAVAIIGTSVAIAATGRISIELVTTIGFSTDTDVREDRRTVPTDEGDHERFSHYVEKDKLTEAMVMGTPVVALCGKVWVPSRDPEKYPVCPECKDAWENLKKDEE